MLAVLTCVGAVCDLGVEADAACGASSLGPLLDTLRVCSCEGAGAAAVLTAWLPLCSPCHRCQRRARPACSTQVSSDGCSQRHGTDSARARAASLRHLMMIGMQLLFSRCSPGRHRHVGDVMGRRSTLPGCTHTQHGGRDCCCSAHQEASSASVRPPFWTAFLHLSPVPAPATSPCRAHRPCAPVVALQELLSCAG